MLKVNCNEKKKRTMYVAIDTWSWSKSTIKSWFNFWESCAATEMVNLYECLWGLCTWNNGLENPFPPAQSEPDPEPAFCQGTGTCSQISKLIWTKWECYRRRGSTFCARYGGNRWTYIFHLVWSQEGPHPCHHTLPRNHGLGAGCPDHAGLGVVSPGTDWLEYW